MHAYRIDNEHGDQVDIGWEETMTGAHEFAKAIGLGDRLNVRIELWDVQNDKHAIVSYLNGNPPSKPSSQVLKRWKLTPRGGLVELGEGED